MLNHPTDATAVELAVIQRPSILALVLGIGQIHSC